MGFLQSDVFLRLISFIFLPAAVAVKNFAAPNTIAYHIADGIIAVVAGIGAYSSTGREKRVE